MIATGPHRRHYALRCVLRSICYSIFITVPIFQSCPPSFTSALMAAIQAPPQHVLHVLQCTSIPAPSAVTNRPAHTYICGAAPWWPTSRSLQMEAFPSKEWICQKGSISDSMFIVMSAVL